MILASDGVYIRVTTYKGADVDDAHDDIEAAHKRYGYVLGKLSDLYEVGGISWEQYETQRLVALNERNIILDFHGVQHVE